MLKQDESMDDSDTSDPQPMEVDGNADTNVKFGSSSDNLPSSNEPVSVCAKALEEFVQQHGLTVHDVPRDGNCMFSSIAYQLTNVGHDVNASTLRQMCVEYLAENSDVYSQFVHQPVASNGAFNADNEPLDDEDTYIQSVTDPIVQQQLRWQKYLRRLTEGAWGDHIAIAAICNLFNMKVKVFHSYPNGTNVVTLNNDCDGELEINIGHIMQFHLLV